MIKLYKRSGNDLDYHEAWLNGRTIYEHFGRCGDKGESRKHILDAALDEDEALERVLATARAQGFEEIDDLSIVLVEYRIEGMGSGDEVSKRHTIEDVLNEALGWAGIGHVDGGSIGSGTMEVCCMVADVAIATRVIEAALEGTNYGDYSRIYEE